jgi:hypothetical protein
MTTMQHREPNTHLWNLSLGVAASTALAACGPYVIPEGETETASTTDTGPGVNTLTPSDTGGPCVRNSDCPPGHACYDGLCIPYYTDTYYCDYGCCDYDPYCYYDTETDTYPPETDSVTEGLDCSSHASCGDQHVCTEQGACEEPSALPPCPDAPVVVPLDLPTLSADELVSLAFVDANGDAARDLVVGRSGSAELLLGPGAGLPIVLPVPVGSTVIDATAGDFDGDGSPELVLSTQDGGLYFMSSDGVGGYVLALTLAAGGPMLDLAALQWNGDGMLDLFGRREGGQAIVHWGDGMLGFPEIYALVSNNPIVSLVAIDLDGDEYGDVVLQDQNATKRYLGSHSGNLTHDGLLPAGWRDDRRLLAGAIDAGAPLELVGYLLGAESTRIELWPQASESPQYYGLPGPRLVGDMGDVDGDGAADLVLGGDGFVDVVRGSVETGQPTLACVSTIEQPSAPTAMAVGDFDGDLRADVALGSARGVTVLLTQ